MNIKHVLITIVSFFLFSVLNPSAIFATSPPCTKTYTDYTILLPTQLPEGVAPIYDNANRTYKLVNTSSTEIYLGKSYTTEQEKLDWMERWSLEEVPHPSDLPKNLHVTTVLKNGQVFEMEKGHLIPKPYDLNLDRLAINFYGGEVETLDCYNYNLAPGVKLDNFSITLYDGNQPFMISGFVLAFPNSPLSYLKYLVYIAIAVVIIVVIGKKIRRKAGGASKNRAH